MINESQDALRMITVMKFLVEVASDDRSRGLARNIRVQAPADREARSASVSGACRRFLGTRAWESLDWQTVAMAGLQRAHGADELLASGKHSSLHRRYNGKAVAVS